MIVKSLLQFRGFNDRPTIPCLIANRKVEKAMFDLGASINVMPLSIYKVLNQGPLKETRVIIQLEYTFNSYLEGCVKEV